MKEVHMEGARGAWSHLPIGSAGGYTPYHNHPCEHVNYVIEGDKSFKMICGVP
ncbi:MAG: hypothetical protein GY790_21365 [Bacteroidetes bacterium]|nr:hypothetical protein [Bacteroidota bacterium]